MRSTNKKIDSKTYMLKIDIRNKRGNKQNKRKNGYTCGIQKQIFEKKNKKCKIQK